MAVNIAYFDSSYLFRFYWNDPGYEHVRTMAASVNSLVCAWHGRAEVISAAHRKFREGNATWEQFNELLQQFHTDCAEGGITWLPLNESILTQVEAVYLQAPASAYLRAADALHLACAHAHGLEEIYSNDRHLLAAAPLFGLRGVNLIP